mgnify:CR=1
MNGVLHEDRRSLPGIGQQSKKTLLPTLLGPAPTVLNILESLSCILTMKHIPAHSFVFVAK